MSVLDFLAHKVRSLTPGQEMIVSGCLLSEIKPVRMAGVLGPEWNACDQIMEQIVGSAYEWEYQLIPESRNYLFRRLHKSDQKHRTYVSPDRRHLYQES